MAESTLVTALLRNNGELLICRRTGSPVSEQQWDGLSVMQKGDDVAPTALQAVNSITGIEPVDCSVVRVASRPIKVSSDTDITAVYPVLIDSSSRDVIVDNSVEEYEWVHAPLVQRRSSPSWLWDSYRRVAPTVRSIAADDEHGATWLSIRGLEVLRDRAGQLVETAPDTDTDELRDLGARLREARPSMAVLHNRVNRVLANATTPAEIEQAATEEIRAAVTADSRATMTAAEILDEKTVLTLSRSGTVLHALRSASVDTIHVLTSRPGGEGIQVAEQLGVNEQVVLHGDAAVAHVLANAGIDVVVIGADTILPDGSVVNKTGTRTAAIAAMHEGIPVYVTATVDKVTTRQNVNLEVGDRTAIYSGDAPIDVRNPTFDVTPPDCIESYITDRGVLSTADLHSIVAELQ